MATLSSCLIWQIISFILPPNEYGCVYAWTALGLRSTYRRCRFWEKNHLFRWRSLGALRVYKQAKLPNLGHRKPPRIRWKDDAPKTSHCLVRIFIQRHNWIIFLGKWARSGCYSQWQSLSGHVERISFTKIEEEDIGNIWFQQDGAMFHTAEVTLDVQDRIISPRADVVWKPRTCDLTPLDHYLWGAVKDKFYADKPEAIEALKDNIREAIDKIQLHTIDNVLKNWTDRLGYSMASRGSHLSEIICHY